MHMPEADTVTVIVTVEAIAIATVVAMVEVTVAAITRGVGRIT